MKQEKETRRMAIVDFISYSVGEQARLTDLDFEGDEKFSKTYILFISLFIYSRYFNTASSNPLLLRGAPDTARILCWSFTTKHHRQL